MEKDESLQGRVFGKLDIHMQRKKLDPHLTLYRNKIKID
jgi:hypothetical protein